ncbi:MAG: peptidase, partial [Gemmatimonadetes bacterium]|nr:peptidase [Gemmatimonadota bacterium]
MLTKSCLVLAAAAFAESCGARTQVATMDQPTVSGPPATVSSMQLPRDLDPTIGLVRDPAITAALGDIDAAHIRHTDSMLVSFGTRNTFSDTMSTARGIGAARRWIHSELEQYSRDCGGCLKVEYYGKINEFRRAMGRDTIVRSANVVDVLAWLPGRDTTHVVVMSGHYDSCVCSVPAGGGSFDSTSNAPGADDDGSGTSAIVELARVFSKRYPKGLSSSILFVAVGAEEQGLNGSTQLAQRLHEQGYKVIAGMTDDIVGNVVAEDGTTDSTTMRIFAADPDNSPSRELGRFTWALSRTYLPNFEVLPVWRLDRIGRGGDHEPYVTLGDAGLRFTERLENYNRQHLPTDDFAHVNFGYVANVARVNAMTVASLASAPPTPANSRAARQGRAAEATAAPSSGGQAWTMSWDASPGATSYEVLIRRTTSPNWETVIPVGNVTRCTLRRQLDDEWSGVRAVSASGARSMAASMPAPNVPRAQRAAGAPAPAAAP